MYETPSPESLRAFMDENHMSGAAVAEIVGVDSRTVRRWTAPPDQPGARAMPWAAWTLLRLYSANLELDEFRMQVIAEHEAKKELS